MDLSRISHAGPPRLAVTRRPPARSLSAAVEELGFRSALSRQLRPGGARATPAGPAPAPAAQVSLVQTAPTQPMAASAPREVSGTGAPKIVLNGAPPPDGGDYKGPAALNPYFATPSSPLAPGSVKGFQNWFQTIQVGQPGDLGSYAWAPSFSATEEGAQEALRIVEQFVPGSKIRSYYYAGQLEGQPPSHAIELPNGHWMNAGLLLDSYYTQGQGVTALSDFTVQEELAVLSRGGYTSIGGA